jgi:hypothetical protein
VGLLGGFHRILDGLERGELDVVELSAHPLDLAYVDILHDVARFRIDRDRSARALPLHALHGLDQRLAIGDAVGCFQRLVDEVHAVIAADRHEVRPETVRLLESFDERLVQPRRMCRRVEVRGDRSEHGVAHAVEKVVVGHVTRADQLDPGLVEPTFDELLDEHPALSGWNEDEDRIRAGVARALQKWGKVGRHQRHPQFADHLASRLAKALFEGHLGIVTRTIVRHHGDDLPDAVLGGPISDDHRRLCHGEARPRDVGRALGDDRGAGRHDDLRNLALRAQRRDRKCAWRDAVSGGEAHLVVDDQLLRDALGIVGHGSIVFDDELDLLAGDHGAVLLHVEARRGGDLLSGRGLLTGHRQDQPDFHDILCGGAGHREAGGGKRHQGCEN